MMFFLSEIDGNSYLMSVIEGFFVVVRNCQLFVIERCVIKGFYCTALLYHDIKYEFPSISDKKHHFLTTLSDCSVMVSEANY